MQSKTLEDMSLHVLKATYYAEQQILKALPKMAEAAQNEELKEAFTQHLTETKTQIQRLEKVFKEMGQSPSAMTCDIIDAMIKTCEKMVSETEAGPVRDAALIFNGQGVEHYEMAHYGTLIAWAEACGKDEVVSLLQETLEEEKNADATLNDVALGDVNDEAANMAKAA